MWICEPLVVVLQSISSSDIAVLSKNIVFSLVVSSAMVAIKEYQVSVRILSYQLGQCESIFLLLSLFIFGFLNNISDKKPRNAID